MFGNVDVDDMFPLFSRFVSLEYFFKGICSPHVGAFTLLSYNKEHTINSNIHSGEVVSRSGTWGNFILFESGTLDFREEPSLKSYSLL